MRDAVLFDLDGTLTDSGPGIRNSVAYSLEKSGICVSDKRALDAFIGPPLMDSFRKFYGMNPEQARRGVVYYREYYRERGIFENSVYEGIPELLRRLGRAGKQVILATSKPEYFALQILEHFGLSGWFDCVAGATMDETRTDKAEVIAYALAKAGVSAEDAVMVGDREHDVLGAHCAGLPCIGVLYGFGSREELCAAGADVLAGTVAELASLLLDETAAGPYKSGRYTSSGNVPDTETADMTLPDGKSVQP